MQPVSNGNFDVALKIDSRLTASAQHTYQGLLIGGDGSNYIYYQVYSDGTNVDLQCTSDIAGTLSLADQHRAFHRISGADLSAFDSSGNHIHGFLFVGWSDLDAGGHALVIHWR